MSSPAAGTSPTDETELPTIVSGTVPSSDFVLEQTMETYPELTFEIEQVVSSGDGTPLPMLWARGGAADDLLATIEADPTVESVSLLREFDEEWLFQVQWDGMVDLVVGMITNSEATILDAVGDGGQWELRVLYPRRSLFSKTHEFCDEHGLEFEVESIREMNGELDGRYGLTTQQYEVLVAAARHGYFDIPREMNLKELAEELDVSHQALSERLRRATASLVNDALVVN